jgi:hypothetical protein
MLVFPLVVYFLTEALDVGRNLVRRNLDCLLHGLSRQICHYHRYITCVYNFLAVSHYISLVLVLSVYTDIF